MNAFFLSPLSLIAFAAVPALIAIYILRNKFRIHIVSSLMLWYDHKKPRQGGLRIHHFQTPLLFILELLSIILLVLAAAGPMLRAKTEARVYVIVLDDSFSMLAQNDGTPRDRAVDAIQQLLKNSGDFQARFILAGQTPRLLARPVKQDAQVRLLLNQWKCLSPTADIDAAVSLAVELASKTGRILVVTDHKAQNIPAKGAIQWWSFGRSVSNFAIVNADRSDVAGRNRCILIVANLSKTAQSTNLKIAPVDTAPSVDDNTKADINSGNEEHNVGNTASNIGDDEIMELVDANSNENTPAGSGYILDKRIQLSPGDTYTAIFDADKFPGILKARLDDDNLNIDNEVLLVPQQQRPVRVQLSIKNELLLKAVDRAVTSVTQARLSSLNPHLLITDSNATIVGGDLWSLRINSDPNAQAYMGPFIVDRSHKLTDGLSLNGVIWGAGKNSDMLSMPVIAAGNVTLLTDTETAQGGHIINMNLKPEISSLTQSMNWPVLIWNLINWRSRHLPGLSQSNYLLGSAITARVDPAAQPIELIGPENHTQQLGTFDGFVTIKPETPGLYKIKNGDNIYHFAVNIMSKSESDITNAQTGQWGKWQLSELYWWEYRPADWALLLIVVLLLMIHRYITAHMQKGSAV